MHPRYTTTFADYTFPGLTTYGSSVKDRKPLVDFMLSALESAGCRILHRPDERRAPFVITFETATGERMGIVAYAFRATRTVTRNRPADERSFREGAASLLQGFVRCRHPSCAGVAALEALKAFGDRRLHLLLANGLIPECKAHWLPRFEEEYRWTKRRTRDDSILEHYLGIPAHPWQGPPVCPTRLNKAESSNYPNRCIARLLTTPHAPR